jgi:hypothetical protein
MLLTPGVIRKMQASFLYHIPIAAFGNLNRGKTSGFMAAIRMAGGYSPELKSICS